MTPFLVPIAAPTAMDSYVKSNSMAGLVFYSSMKSVYFGTFLSYVPLGVWRSRLAMPSSLLDFFYGSRGASVIFLKIFLPW